MTSSFRVFAALVKKDLKQEFRTRDMLTSMGIYALLVIVVYGAALALIARGTDIMQMSGGLLWVLIVFSSLLGLGRSFAYEREQSCLEGILLTPIDRSIVYLSKVTTNCLFMFTVELIAVPLFCFFFLTGQPLAPSAFAMLAPLLAGTVGMAGVGTMLSTITMGTRSRDVLLAVLFVPLIFPLLYGCVTATTAAIVGSELWAETFLVPLVLVCGYDIVMLAVCWLLYDFVLSA